MLTVITSKLTQKQMAYYLVKFDRWWKWFLIKHKSIRDRVSRFFWKLYLSRAADNWIHVWYIDNKICNLFGLIYEVLWKLKYMHAAVLIYLSIDFGKVLIILLIYYKNSFTVNFLLRFLKLRKLLAITYFYIMWK